MKINTATGELYGMPLEVCGTIAVNVYASNNWGTAVTSIMFTVVDPQDDEGDEPDDIDLGFNPKPKKVYRTKEEAIDDFEQMLKDLKCSVAESWGEVQIRLKKDDRFYALHMMAERRRVWQRYIKEMDIAAPTQPAMQSKSDPTPNPVYQTQTYPPATPLDAFKQLLIEKLSSKEQVF
eukprot:UN22446